MQWKVRAEHVALLTWPQEKRRATTSIYKDTWSAGSERRHKTQIISDPCCFSTYAEYTLFFEAVFLGSGVTLQNTAGSKVRAACRGKLEERSIHEQKVMSPEYTKLFCANVYMQHENQTS